jgi:hypothetical protein
MSTFFRRDGSVNAANGFALTGVEVYVCTQPNSLSPTNIPIPPSPLATIYSDNAGADPITQPILTDGLGNYDFYAPTGTYSIVYFDPLGRIPSPILFPDQEVVSPGGGSVTSVAITGDGVIFASSISGSPISSSGTFNLLTSLLTQNANRVLAGPASGGAATPTFRALVAADFPAGVGTVTSVALALNGSTLLSLSVSGSPVTGSGTLTGTINFVNQSANTVLAGPTSGAATAPSFRALAAADIFGTVATSFSASPTFNAAAFASPTFTMTLTGNVTSSTVTNPIAGQRITFIITQDGTGGRTFAWPSNFKGYSGINADSQANSVFVQSFVWDGTNWRADSPGNVNQS